MTPNPTKNVCCARCFQSKADGGACDYTCPCHSIPKDSWVEETIAEFEAKFVEDAVSLEFTNDGKSLVQNPDTRLMADYIDGKTLTAKQITDWLRATLTAHNKQIREAVEKLREEVPPTPQVDLGDSLLGPKFVLIADAQGHNRAIESVLSLLEE